MTCLRARWRFGKVGSVENREGGRRLVVGLYKWCANSGGMRCHVLVPEKIG